MSKKDRKKKIVERIRARQAQWDETTRQLEQRIQELTEEIDRRRASS